MISNYAKQKLFDRVNKKTYTRNQISILLFIVCAKTVLSIENIRLALHDFHEGNDTMEELYQYCSESLMSTLSSFYHHEQSETPILHFLNPVIGLLYGAQIDSPKRWGSSNASLSNMRFKLELRCGYGNNLSYLQDIVVPTCMMLCAGLPRGAGPQSFGSPFYVEYYSKGRGQSCVGLITSISIERGVGNKGWTRKGFPLGVDINVEITDMTDVVFSPTVANVSILGKWINPMEENAMGDYLAVMSALGINEQIYLLPRLKRRANKFISEFNSWTSPSRWAALSVETFPGRIINAFSDQMSRR